MSPATRVLTFVRVDGHLIRVSVRGEGRPLLLIMGGQDHTVPEAITKSTLKQYRHSHAINDLFEFPDRGHSLTIDHGWRDIASPVWFYGPVR